MKCLENYLEKCLETKWRKWRYSQGSCPLKASTDQKNEVVDETLLSTSASSHEPPEPTRHGYAAPPLPPPLPSAIPPVQLRRLEGSWFCSVTSFTEKTAQNCTFINSFIIIFLSLLIFSTYLYSLLIFSIYILLSLFFFTSFFAFEKLEILVVHWFISMPTGYSSATLVEAASAQVQRLRFSCRLVLA